MIFDNTALERAIFEYTNGIGYVVIDDLFNNDLMISCEREFLEIDDSEFVHYSNPMFEFNKYALNNSDKIPKTLGIVFDTIHSEDFVNRISNLSGIGGLLTDGKRWGGGLHKTKKDGYLSIHRDFNILPTSYSSEKQMLRCLNLIGYMNSDWQDGDGGELEFWDSQGREKVVAIEPKFNRWVLFDTRNNYHGHPFPYNGRNPRISIASYYYVEECIDESIWSSTQYIKLPWMEETEEYARQRKERADHKRRYSNMLNKTK